jgi:hypothetical protein
MSAILERSAAASSKAEAEEAKFLWPPILISIVLLWLVPMSTSLGLDETGTWWVVKDGLRQTIERAKIWPAGQSILFDSILLAVRAVAGDSDFAMRAPSVAAMGIALILLYRLGRKFFGPLAAMFSCLVFITLRDVVYVASTVRPYALGLLFVIAAMLALVNWIDTGKFRHGAAYSILAALTVHAHYFLGVMFLVHAMYLFARIRGGTSSIGWKQVLLGWLGSAVFLLPAAPFALSLNAARSQHVYLPTPDVETALTSLVPILLTGAFAVAILLRIVARKPVTISADFSGLPVWLCAAWALVPPGITFLISLMTPLKLFAPRYYVAFTPGLALFAAYLFQMLGPRSLRLLIAAALTVAAVLSFAINERATRGTVDFRGAARAIREHVGQQDTPVLVVPGFREGETVQAVLNPAITDVLFAPYLRYNFGALVRLPASFEPEAEAYIDKTFADSLVHQHEFFIAGLMLSERYQDWLRARAKPFGFRSRVFGNYGGVEVMIFARGGS